MNCLKKYFFYNIIFIVIIPLIGWGAEMTKQMTSRESTIFDFGNKDQYEACRIVNDGVMGGISKSEMIAADSTTATFQGDVSLENNGGFASVRTMPHKYNLDGYTGITIRVRGDGKKYQFRIRIDNRFDGISYRYIFDTKPNKWMTIHMPFSDFVPTFRGRILDEDPLSAKEIEQLGFLIADKQAGNFRLEIDWIKAYKK